MAVSLQGCDVKFWILAMFPCPMHASRPNFWVALLAPARGPTLHPSFSGEERPLVPARSWGYLQVSRSFTALLLCPPLAFLWLFSSHQIHTYHTCTFLWFENLFFKNSTRHRQEALETTAMTSNGGLFVKSGCKRARKDKLSLTKTKMTGSIHLTSIVCNLICPSLHSSTHDPWTAVMTTFQPSSPAWPGENWGHRVWGLTKHWITQVLRIHLSLVWLARDNAFRTDTWVSLSSLCCKQTKSTTVYVEKERLRFFVLLQFRTKTGVLRSFRDTFRGEWSRNLEGRSKKGQ